MKELFAALFAAQAEFPKVKKDAKNPHWHSRYATLDGAQETLEPTLRKYKLFIIQPASGNGIGTGCRTFLCHQPSGEFIDETLLLPSNAPGNAIANAQTGTAAVTYARRVGYLSILGISPSDDDDGETAVGRGRPQSGQKKNGKKKTDPAPEPEKGPGPPKAEIPSFEEPSVFPTDDEYKAFKTQAEKIKTDLEKSGVDKPGKKLAEYFLKEANVDSLTKLTKLQWEVLLKKVETVDTKTVVGLVGE
jgi:hypothetical protein